MNLRDLLWGAWLATFRRLTRSSLTIISLAIGTGAIVSILCISQSGAAQIAIRLSDLDVNSAVVTIDNGDSWAMSDAEIVTRAAQLPETVQSIGTFTIVDSANVPPISTSLSDRELAAPIVIASSEGIHARGGSIVSGAFPAVGLADHGATFVALGVGLAQQLDIDPIGGNKVIRVGGQLLRVVALVADNSKNSLLSTAVVVPPQLALDLGLRPSARDLIAQAYPHHAAYLPTLLPRILNPHDPSVVNVSLPPEAQALKQGISSDARASVLLVAIATLIISTLSVITTMQVAIRERHSEIGVLRSLGMSRAQVALKFLLESAMLGILGSAVGWVLGIVIAALAIAINRWSRYFPEFVGYLPLLGLAVGIVGGLVPAVRASLIQPLTLIRETS